MPKLRVTCFSWAALLPQLAQWCSTEVDGDDKEPAGCANFDDCLGRCAFKGNTGDDALAFAGLRIALPVADLPCKDDVFKIEDSELVIFKLFSGVG